MSLNVNFQGVKNEKLLKGGSVTGSSISYTTKNEKGSSVTYQGAWANIFNPLNIPIKGSNIIANLYLHKNIEFDINTNLFLSSYKCRQNPSNGHRYTHINQNSKKSIREPFLVFFVFFNLNGAWTHLSSVYGMYPKKPKQNWVMLQPNTTTSFFVKGGPIVCCCLKNP